MKEIFSRFRLLNRTLLAESLRSFLDKSDLSRKDGSDSASRVAKSHRNFIKILVSVNSFLPSRASISRRLCSLMHIYFLLYSSFLYIRHSEELESYRTCIFQISKTCIVSCRLFAGKRKPLNCLI